MRLDFPEAPRRATLLLVRSQAIRQIRVWGPYSQSVRTHFTSTPVSFERMRQNVEIFNKSPKANVIRAMLAKFWKTYS